MTSAAQTVERIWNRTAEGPVRCLIVNRYDAAGNERQTIVRRLAGDDPRPLGRECCGHTALTVALLAALPLGEWVELIL